jgi:hypothetical protein
MLQSVGLCSIGRVRAGFRQDARDEQDPNRILSIVLIVSTPVAAPNPCVSLQGAFGRIEQKAAKDAKRSRDFKDRGGNLTQRREVRGGALEPRSIFGSWISDLIRHSDFGIRHFLSSGSCLLTLVSCHTE